MCGSGSAEVRPASGAFRYGSYDSALREHHVVRSTLSMTDTDRASDMISFRLDGALADELDRVARQDGLSRSGMLRELLLGRVQEPPRTRCIRLLWTIHGELQVVVDVLNDDEEEDVASLVQDAVDSVAESLEELGQEFADEEDED